MRNPCRTLLSREFCLSRVCSRKNQRRSSRFRFFFFFFCCFIFLVPALGAASPSFSLALFDLLLLHFLRPSSFCLSLPFFVLPPGPSSLTILVNLQTRSYAQSPRVMYSGVSVMCGSARPEFHRTLSVEIPARCL